MSVTVSATHCRRQRVTVLFVDIVGFTDLVDELDCADVHALQCDYFAQVSAVVRECGGVVEKFVGDAVMAVFGVRTGAREGAASAVRAGLLIQAALRGRRLAGRFEVSTRAGLATGDVIVDLAAAVDGGQAMVSGSVVTTAARLQAYAPSGTTVVCAATRELTSEVIAYQELPPAVLAGKSRPVELSRALHPQGVVLPVRVIHAMS
jgi:class 3 adenylate cyclase